MLRVESPQTLLLSPGFVFFMNKQLCINTQGLEDRDESPESPVTNEVQNSNAMILLQRITMTINENAATESRIEFPENTMKMFPRVRHTSRNTNSIFLNSDLVNKASAGCAKFSGSPENLAIFEKIPFHLISTQNR